MHGNIGFRCRDIVCHAMPWYKKLNLVRFMFRSVGLSTNGTTCIRKENCLLEAIFKKALLNYKFRCKSVSKTKLIFVAICISRSFSSDCFEVLNKCFFFFPAILAEIPMVIKIVLPQIMAADRQTIGEKTGQSQGKKLYQQNRGYIIYQNEFCSRTKRDQSIEKVLLHKINNLILQQTLHPEARFRQLG